MTELGKNVGQFVSGSFTKLVLRKKSDQKFEIGELLVAGKNLQDYVIYQINELAFGSQIPASSLELMSGYQLEREKTDLSVYEPELRNYILAQARPLICIKANEKGKLKPFLPKELPEFFENAYELEDTHLRFLEESKIENPMIIGKVRSGSRVLDTKVSLEASEVITHHILIPATTGRGKSNLVKVILYNLMENEFCGKLVFDPHNEYYESLKEHPQKLEFLKFYSPRDHPNKIDLKVNASLLKPSHIMGAISLTDAQNQGLMLYYRNDRENNYEHWVRNIFLGDVPAGIGRLTVEVLRRKIGILLNIAYDTDPAGNIIEESLQEHGIYTFEGNQLIISDIKKFLKDGKTVIIDTSLFGGAEEIFIATIIVESLFYDYKNYKFHGKLEDYPLITIVLEEAPRVIGKKVLDVRENIFGTIAKEGRKFNIGLIAITQLPSVIPREVLANMNTKIILGNEMGPERRAIIESAAQDLSDDYQNIGSLDKGEAIITSNFTKFAIPIKIPLFSELVKNDMTKRNKNAQNIKKRSPF
jgi:hypothetical protein